MRVRHLAKHIQQNGNVSPLCAPKPRALNMEVATWTTDKRAVTCRKCLSMLDRSR